MLLLPFLTTYKIFLILVNYTLYYIKIDFFISVIYFKAVNLKSNILYEIF
jgi:hypothetical protein